MKKQVEIEVSWTPEQIAWLKEYLKPQVDRIWTWWPPKNEARKLARGSKWDRQICNHCKGDFLKSDTEVDHIDPTIDTMKGFEDPLQYQVRKLVQTNELQVLCKPCHRKKSASENVVRGVVRNSKKTIKRRKR